MIGMSLSRVTRTLSGVLAMVAVGACTPPAQSHRGAADGTLALSNDGKLLYTANGDANTVTVVDTGSRQIVATVAVGTHPSRLAVGPDDTLYVSNRGSRNVSVVHRGTWSEASRLTVGAEPLGLAVSQDGATIYVVNSAAGSLDAIDLTSPANTQRWATALGDEPRSVAVLPDGRLYVSHYKTGQVDIVDGKTGALRGSISTAVGIDPALAQTPFGFGGQGPAPTFRPIALDSIVVSRDGTRAYLVHRRDRNGVIRTDRAFGYYTALTNTTPVVVPGLTTLMVAQDLARDDATDPTKDYPPTVLFPSQAPASSSVSLGGPPPSSGFGASSGGSGGGYGGTFAGSPWTQGPIAAVEDSQGEFLFVANENTDDVTILSTHSRTAQGASNGIIATVPVGTAPTGVAISGDGKTLFVHNGLDYSVSFVERGSGVVAEVARVTVSNPGALDADSVEGRRLFFSAEEPAMTVPGGGVACESCHTEGGSDANVWQFTNGPRKTPSLFGRHIKDTAPYHWAGTQVDFHDFFAETVQVRMGGLGVTDQQSQQIATFMDGLGSPDNPFVQPGGLTAAQARGRALFTGKAACMMCHNGPDLTDNLFHDVGSFVSVNPNGNPDDACLLDPSAGVCVGTGPNGVGPRANPGNLDHGFNTPSLLGVVWAAPYLHDGSALTLRDRLVTNPGDAHGHTSALTSGEVDDLVQYLQTL